MRVANRLLGAFILLIALAGCGGGTNVPANIPLESDAAVTATPAPVVPTPTPISPTPTPISPTPTPAPTQGTVQVQAIYTAAAPKSAAASGGGLPAATATLSLHLIDGTGRDTTGLPLSVTHTPGDTAAQALPPINAAPGTYTLIAVLFGADDGLLGLASIQVTITAGQTDAVTLDTSQQVTALAITPSTSLLAVGATQALTATATLADTTTLNATPLAAWSSSSTAVATISDAGGSIGTATAVNAGLSTITAGLGSLKSTATVLVNLSSLSVTPPTSSIGTRSTAQLTAVGTFGNGTTDDLTSRVTWSSSDDTLATVSPGGLVSAQGNLGTVTVSAAVGTFTAQATVQMVAGVDFTVRQINGSFRNIVHDGKKFVAMDDNQVWTSSDGVTWLSGVVPIVGNHLLNAMIYDGHQFIVVGFYAATFGNNEALILTSPDAVTWTRQSTPGTTGLRDICFDGTTYVAVGGLPMSGYTYTSTDGVNWVLHLGATSSGLVSVAATKGVFVAAPFIGTRVFSSTDGVTWVPRSMSIRPVRVAAGNGIFVASAPSEPSVVISSDGENWSAASPGIGGGNGLGFANGRFFVSSSNNIATSPDGAAWTTASGSGNRTIPLDVAFGNGRYVVAGAGMATSLDAATFTVVPGMDLSFPPSFAGRTLVAFGNGVFVEVSSSQVRASADLTTFPTSSALAPSIVTTPKLTVTCTDLEFADGEFRVVTADTDNTMRRLTVNPDNTVTATTIAMPTAMRAIAFGNGTWVAVGDQGTIVTTPGGSLTPTTQNSGTTEPLTGVAFGDGTFVAVGSGGTLLTSPNGIDWTPQSGPDSNNVAFGGGRFMTISNNGIATSTDGGVHWTTLTSPTSQRLASIGFANGSFYLGSFGGEFVSTDGSAWTRLDTVVQGAFHAVAFGNGRIVLAGSGATDPDATTSTNAVLVSSP